MLKLLATIRQLADEELTFIIQFLFDFMHNNDGKVQMIDAPTDKYFVKIVST